MIEKSPGSESWWSETVMRGIPAIHCNNNETCTVTFFWRDPQGCEQTSSVKRVWIYITGITDHHHASSPQSLIRLPGTDVWQWQTELSAHWRGSYCFIPSCREDDFAASAFAAEQPDKTAIRNGWGNLIMHAIADPLNPHCWPGGRGHPVSALHMPAAIPQPGWDKPQTPYMPPQCLDWYSLRLGNQRRVWLFSTGKETFHPRPLAILLDGQFWAESMPIWPALQAQTDAGALPPAVYVLIDAIDNDHRSRELTCNDTFWLAVQEELLPQLKTQICWHDSPETTVVAGQSFGGLSALYAGLHWPERFGCVLSQSGSFWWPHRNDRIHSGQLICQLTQTPYMGRPLRIFLEAGRREPLIHRVNTQMYALLQQTQPALCYHETDGGHDALCWRGGLIEGLQWLWQAN